MIRKMAWFHWLKSNSRCFRKKPCLFVGLMANLGMMQQLWSPAAKGMPPSIGQLLLLIGDTLTNFANLCCCRSLAVAACTYQPWNLLQLCKERYDRARRKAQSIRVSIMLQSLLSPTSCLHHCIPTPLILDLFLAPALHHGHFALCVQITVAGLSLRILQHGLQNSVRASSQSQTSQY